LRVSAPRTIRATLHWRVKRGGPGIDTSTIDVGDAFERRAIRADRPATLGATALIGAAVGAHGSEIVSSPTSSDRDEPTTVPLRVSRQATIDLVHALDVLSTLDWLGTAAEPPAELAGQRRIKAVLDLPILDGSGSRPIHKAALIDVGPPLVQGDVVLQAIGWQSDSMAPLFPVFAGQLRVTSAGVALNGRYAPPFGRLGLLVDERVLHFVARRTAQAFLDRVADRLTT